MIKFLVLSSSNATFIGFDTNGSGFSLGGGFTVTGDPGTVQTDIQDTISEYINTEDDTRITTEDGEDIKNE